MQDQGLNFGVGCLSPNIYWSNYIDVLSHLLTVTVSEIWRKVKVKGHVDEVIQALEDISS